MAAAGTFLSQTRLIVDLALESAASVVRSFGAERPDSEEEQVRSEDPGGFYPPEDPEFVSQSLGEKSRRHFRLCGDDKTTKKKQLNVPEKQSFCCNLNTKRV